MYLCIYMYVCMYVFIYVCMYVWKASDNKRLLSERSEWTTLFSSIMSLEGADKDVSPATVLASLRLGTTRSVLYLGQVD